MRKKAQRRPARLKGVLRLWSVCELSGAQLRKPANRSRRSLENEKTIVFTRFRLLSSRTDTERRP